MTDSIMQIIPGIWQFRLPIPATIQAVAGEMIGETNVYLVGGENDWLLVDAGWDDHGNLSILQEGLKVIGADFSDIHRIVITHFHLDHFGMAGKLRQVTGAELALHRDDSAFVELLNAKADQILDEGRNWLLCNGTPENELPDDTQFLVDMEAPGRLLSGGETISTGLFDFEVLWTPGHTPGHICLYERRKKLFISGDHMLGEITPEVGTTPLQHINPLGDYLDCLEQLRELDVELVLPAHGSPFAHFRRRTDELIEHHQERKDVILKLLKQGPMRAYDIATKVRWIPQAGGVPWEKLDVMNRRFALFETWAHLRLLENEGEIATLARDGFIFYSIDVRQNS